MIIKKENVVYDNNKSLKVDIYFPSNTTTSTKILIFWHGGGWFRGGKESVKDVGVDLANAGFATFIPDYRLAPQSTFPAAHDDAETFVKWLINSEYTDEGDEKNIFQIGSSVGGTMALYIAGKYGFPTVTWSAPVDFSNWIKKHPSVKPSFKAKEELGLSDRHSINDAFYKYFVLTYTGNEEDSVLQKLDAKNYDYTNLNSLLMFNSADELTPLNGLWDFADSLAKEDHEFNISIIPGHGHAMDYGRKYLTSSIEFFKKVIYG